MTIIKCDLCGDVTTGELKVKRNGQKLKTLCHFCDKCEETFGELLVETANERMRQKFGKRAITFPTKLSKQKLEEKT